MKTTNEFRKIDSSGRLVIPSKLRDSLYIEVGDSYEFFLHEDEEGKKFLCIECYKLGDEIERAKRILRDAGLYK
jgi:bifunctional DNA-binding transcriptional regulator/antitoxin component of YhaV-PrlF toxin-antitoxin module